MIKRLQQNQWAKAENAFWWLSLDKLEKFFFYLLLLFLPTQLGKHFWFPFSFILGQRIDYLSPTVYLTDIFIITLFFLSFPKLLRFFLSERSWSKDVNLRQAQTKNIYLLFVLFVAVSIFLSNNAMAGWYWMAKFLEMSFLVWYVSRAVFSQKLVGIFLFLGIVFESILSMAQVVHQGSLGGIFYYAGERSFGSSTPGIANASVNGQLVLRSYATFSHPNMLAGYFVVVMLLVIFFLFKRKTILFRSTLFLSLLFGTLGLTISLSRTGIAAWVLVGVTGIIIHFRKKVTKLRLIASLVVASSLLLAVVFDPLLLFRLTSFSFGQSLAERSSLAQSALAMIVSHPIFGVGPNNFISSLPVGNLVILQPVHNIYLLVASELGIPGFLLFLGILLKAFQKTRRRDGLFLNLAFFSILFLGFFDHYFLTLQQGQLLFSLCLGFLFSPASSSHDTMKK